MKFFYASVIVCIIGATFVCGKPQLPDNAAIVGK